MTPQQNSERLKERRRKLLEAGLVEVRAYVLLEHKDKCEAFLKRHGEKK